MKNGWCLCPLILAEACITCFRIVVDGAAEGLWSKPRKE